MLFFCWINSLIRQQCRSHQGSKRIKNLLIMVKWTWLQMYKIKRLQTVTWEWALIDCEIWIYCWESKTDGKKYRLSTQIYLKRLLKHDETSLIVFDKVRWIHQPTKIWFQFWLIYENSLDFKRCLQLSVEWCIYTDFILLLSLK